MGVERAQKNFVAQNREPAIHAPAARTNVRGQLMLILPDGPAGARIERKRAIVLTGAVQNAVHDQRRGFKLSRRASLVHPLRDQRLHIRRVDLIQRAEAAARVVARIRQPVLRLLGGIEQPLECDLRVASQQPGHSRRAASENARQLVHCRSGDRRAHFVPTLSR